MGSIGKSSAPAVTYEVDTESAFSYRNRREDVRQDMEDAMEDVKKSINDFMERAWSEKDVEHLWEAIHDYYPRSLPGDESEKVVYVDTKNQRITGVDISLSENANGGITAKLNPFSVSFNEWTKKELYDYFGIEEE